MAVRLLRRDARATVQAGHRAATISRSRPRPSACPELDAVRHRLSPALLAHAEWRAAALNTGADRVLVAERSISEDDYLRSYAHFTGIAFEPLEYVPRAACPLDDERMLDALAAGILPLLERGELLHVVAPRGMAARRMLQIGTDVRNVRSKFRVTSAERLRRFVFHHCSAALGLRAADALRIAAPSLSAAPTTRSTSRRWWAVIAALGVASAVTAPAATRAGLDVAFSLLFLAWMAVRLLGIFIKPPKAQAPMAIADADLPVYTVVAAIYREAASAADLVSAIRQLAWPPEKLDVKLVVEADDAATRDAIARLDLEPCFEVLVAPSAGPRTKPKALNAALPFVRGTFTVIYDAEDRPEPNQLRAALDAFLNNDHDLACVQAALTIDNTADSWLARMFTAEYAAHFDVLLPSLAALHLPLPLGGSSNHFRGIRQQTHLGCVTY